MTEGECGIMKLIKAKSDDGSFRQTTSATFLSEEGLGGDSAPSEKAVSLDESIGSADVRS